MSQKIKDLTEHIKNISITYDDIIEALLVLISEVIEAFIIYGLYTYLANNVEFNWSRTVKMSFVIGLITWIAQKYNPFFKQTIKSGILNSVGTGMLKNM